MSGWDIPDPDNPGVSIAYVLGHIADRLERISNTLDSIDETLDETLGEIRTSRDHHV